ncbi:MAG: hypothetical protein ACYTHJ_06630 [Planctomycetota bacterium]|jgi:hypothetical protein
MNSILKRFLDQQTVEAEQLSEHSDLVDVHEYDLSSGRFVARFDCLGVVRRQGHIEKTSGFLVGIRFTADHLRRLSAPELLTWLGPDDFWHPNVLPRIRGVCVGGLAAACGMNEICGALFEVITGQVVALDDVLNPAAAQDYRHSNLWPVDRRPMKWRAVR